MIRAIDVLRAAKSTYDRLGDEAYAINKTMCFMSRCGISLESRPEQLLEIEVVERAVYALLDPDAEKTFWESLNNIANKEIECD
jgi:replicative superfamily II helicase